MKKTYRFLLILLLFVITTSLFAQSPQRINYQAVARDNAGDIIANQSVNFIIYIHDGSPSGTDVYHETHNVSTNQFGLVNLEIGGGTNVFGVFSSINWSSGDKYIEIQLDPTGTGTSFTTVGTPQLLSVPYALYANQAGTSGPMGATGPTGPSGTNGGVGAQGPTGPTGPSGTNGTAGAQGPTGPTGPSGTNGTAGAQGPTGPTGPSGTNGTAGAQGPTGPTGPSGANGTAGPTGAQGPTGVTGATGKTGTTGLLQNGTAAGNTTYWDGSQWVVNNNNIFNNGGNVGIGATVPGATLHIISNNALPYQTLRITNATASSASIMFDGNHTDWTIGATNAGHTIGRSKLAFSNTNTGDTWMSLDSIGQLGIGINFFNVVARLQVYNGAVMFDGTTGNTPTSGAGTRFMWIPAKNAIRAGAVSGAIWDDASIGINSVGFGYDALSNAYATTVAGGHTNKASKDTATVSGGFNNTASGYSAAVSGGRNNTASDTWAFVGGGKANMATDSAATVAGGVANQASAMGATIAGGISNRASAQGAAIGGGSANQVLTAGGAISGGALNYINAYAGFIGGGFRDTITGQCGVVVGGTLNSAKNMNAFVGGGSQNRNSGNNAAIVGGSGNTVSGMGIFGFIGSGVTNSSTNQYGSVINGVGNTASGIRSIVGTGMTNVASGMLASVVNGQMNTANNNYGTILNGMANTISAGDHSLILGGQNNMTIGNYSVLYGQNINNTGAQNFVWNPNGGVCNPSRSDLFVINIPLSGAVAVGTANPTPGLSMDVAVGIAGGINPWFNYSDRTLKTNINTINNALDKVMHLRGVTYEWKDKAMGGDGLKIGFIAQEVEQVLPEVILKGGNKLMMSYAPVTALLVEAMKEQQKTIENQQLQIDELKKMVEQLLNK
jgi:hypothetical protein